MIVARGLSLAALPSPRQDDLSHKAADLVRAWQREGAPGAVLGVLRDGEIALVQCFGAADLAAGRPNAVDTPFYVASLAKPFTAACVLHAAARGAFDLDASVTQLFPELPPTYAAATVRQLISHRSGVPDVYDAAVACDLGLAPVRSNTAAVGLLARLPRLAFTPGTRMLYSNPARASPANDDEMPAAHAARQAAAAALRPRELPGSRIFAWREDSRT